MEAQQHCYYYNNMYNNSIEDECRVVLNNDDEDENGCGHYRENGKGLSLTLGNSSGAFNPNHQYQFQTNDNDNSNSLRSRSVNHNDQSCAQSCCHHLHTTFVRQLLHNCQYMKAAQQLMDEVVCVSNAAEFAYDHPSKQASAFQSNSTASATYHPSKCALNDLDNEEESSIHVNAAEAAAAASTNYAHENHHHLPVTVSRLVALLRQLERRYEKYLHEMEMVVSSFEAVAGVGAASSYTTLTIQAMSKHFSNLRHAIITQINNCSSTSKLQHLKHKRDDALFQPQAGFLSSSSRTPQIWRAVRGLPEDSVSKLRAWLFHHFLHPYPSDEEKLTLASQTGLTRNQISNWFINARVRLWKPMIEDMYKEEFGKDI